MGMGMNLIRQLLTMPLFLMPNFNIQGQPGHLPQERYLLHKLTFMPTAWVSRFWGLRPRLLPHAFGMNASLSGAAPPNPPREDRFAIWGHSAI